MNKILIASDIHLHRWNNFGYHADTLLPKRLFDQQQVLLQIENLIREHKVKIFINGGDLFHSVGNIPVEALNIAHRFYHALDMMGVTCLFVPGNHDMIKRESPEWFHISTGIFDKVAVEQNLGFKVKLIGFDEPVDYDKIKGYDIVVLHKTPINAKVNNYTFDDGVNWKKLALQNKLVCFGHIHQRAKLGDNCYIIGSPMHLTFGDTGTRGVYLTDTDTFKAEFIKLDYPEFITVDSEKDIKEDNNYYRVLGADKRIDRENVVSIVKPQVFKERIKSEDFQIILEEWVKLNKKPKKYIKGIEPLLVNKANLGNKVFTGRLTDIHIKDFISIGEIEHTFENGFTSISGPNGNGKTAFVDAVFWCLFGETTKGLTGNDVIRRGCDDCGITIRLVAEDTTYSVFRSRRSGLDIHIEGSKTPLMMHGMKASDKQKILEDILGFNKAVFLSACYFSQENVKTLTGLTDTEKTNMITSLLGFETYDDLYANVSTQIVERTTAVDDWESKKTNIGTTIEISKGALDVIEKEVKSLKQWIWDHMETRDKYKAEIKELQNKDDIGSSFVPIDYDSKLDALNKKDIVLSESIDEVDTEMAALNKRRESVSIHINEIKIKLANAHNTIQDIEKEIKLLQKVELGEKCDKCGSMITEDNIDIFIKEKEEKIITLRKTHLIQDELKPLMDERNEIDTKRAAIEQDKVDYNKKGRDIRENRESILGLKKEQDIKLQEIAKKDADTDAKIDSLLTLIQESKDSIKKLEERRDILIADTEKEKEKIAEAESQIFEADSYIEKLQGDLEIFEFWKVAFSSKGIRGLLLDRFCNQFNAIVNDYLSKASNGRMSIVLNPIKVLKSGEDRNKISLDINMDDTIVSYSSLSGGEKRRVDVSLCLTLNKWLSNRCGLVNGLLGLIIFDELFSFLDREGEENIGGLLYEEGSDKIILVISHTPELASYAQHILNISKVNGISKLMD